MQTCPTSRISHGPSLAGDEQKSDNEQRAYDVHVKRNTRVARREVPRHDHLSHVPYGVAESRVGWRSIPPRTLTVHERSL